MIPNKIQLNDYDYILPDELIARYPNAEREASRLLVYNGQITHSDFVNVGSYLQPGDSLFLNKSKVMPARLYVKKSTGATMEILLLKPADGQIPTRELTAKHTSRWEAMIGNLKKWNEGEVILIESGTVSFKVTLEQKNPNIVRFDWVSHHIFNEIIEETGRIPIPPYLNREDDVADRERYQTVYAEAGGSVAAPTAGLHFTADILNELVNRGIKLGFLTLHVGAGTFLPVKEDIVFNHDMHFEMIEIERSTLMQLKSMGRKIAVGTTSLRTLESIYWLGHQTIIQGFFSGEVRKEYPYSHLDNRIDLRASLDALIAEMDRLSSDVLFAQTQLYILPGYKFKVVEVLITNFHQPCSTLLMLVDAFTGAWKEIYAEAVEKRYRFLSYGDSSILFLKQS